MMLFIGDRVFAGLDCEAVIAPDGWVGIGAEAFMGCANLVFVRVPDSVIDLAADAFDGFFAGRAFFMGKKALPAPLQRKPIGGWRT